MASSITHCLIVVILTLYCASVHSSVPTTSCARSFCERSSVYPISPSFQRNMENDPRFASLKGVVVPGISSNMGDDDPSLPADDVQYQICKSKSDVIFPQEAQNTRGQRKFIINFGPFAQGIAIERCSSDSFRQPCNYIGTPPDYQSVCVQKEMEHRLTTIESDPSTGSVSTSVDIFRFPSYCACKLVKGSRSGAASLCGTPPMLSSPIMYGPVSYGADEGTGSEKKSTRPGVTRQPLPGQQRPLQLSSRTMDLFG